jgi:ribosome-binding protein aMBF1 (putative translation factor)
LLRAERQKAGFSQNMLADKLNKPQSFVAKVEKGERRVDVIEFLTIISTLGADPVQFIREMQKSSPPT